MMSFIANAGAVPLGYVSAMTDGQGQGHHTSGGFYVHREEMVRLQHLQQRLSALSPLPDVILSNAPSSSPLQRPVSCCPFHHRTINHTGSSGKGLTNSDRRLSSRTGHKPGPRQYQSPCPVNHLVRRCSNHEAQQIAEGHLHQMTRGSRVHHKECVDQGCCSSHLGIPQLLRQIPPFGRLNPNVLGRPRAKSSTADGNVTSEIQDLCCTVGKELQKIADRFQLDHGKVKKKTEQAAAVSLVLPEAFTRCLAASVMCLIWWRLLNKLR
ncbi:uncharacterized protein [Macrobrachium rosenbergii]|uniref:uncharacterized protein n=1 Tax=Macrobrachium rosenbergii TaxID=79674 RepID=UPI0034D73921